MGLYEFECQICKKISEEYRVMSKRNDPFICCEEKAIRLICRNVQVEKDQMWNFRAGFMGDIPIHGKTQYKRLLKQHGLADMTIKECLSVKPKKESDFRYRRKQTAERVMERLNKEGLAKDVKPFIEKYFVKKEK